MDAYFFPVISPRFPCYDEIVPCYFRPIKSTETSVNAALLDDLAAIPATIIRFSLYFSLLTRGDRFDSDCVHHHAVPYKQRFPGVVQIAPNWWVFVRGLCL
jgi:hypothetical protein